MFKRDGIRYSCIVRRGAGINRERGEREREKMERRGRHIWKGEQEW